MVIPKPNAMPMPKAGVVAKSIGFVVGGHIDPNRQPGEGIFAAVAIDGGYVWSFDSIKDTGEAVEYARCQSEAEMMMLTRFVRTKRVFVAQTGDQIEEALAAISAAIGATRAERARAAEARRRRAE